MKKLFALVVLLGMLAPASVVSAQVWESDDAYGTEYYENGYYDDNWGYDTGLYEDDEYFTSDDYGYYDSDYDWDTDEGWFDGWFDDSDEWF